MANDEIYTKVVYDTSEFVPSIAKQIEEMEKVSKSWDDLQKSSKKSSDEQAKALQKIIDSERDLINETKKVVKENKEVGKSTTGLTGIYNRFITTIKNKRQETNKLTAERIKLLRQYSQEKKAIAGVWKELDILGTNMGELTNLLGSARKLTGLFIRVLGRFKVALIGTGIGAIVVALGSLIAYLTKSQEGMDKLTRILAQASAAVKVITDRFVNLGKSIFNGDLFRNIGEGFKKFFTNPLKAVKDGFESAKESVKGFTEEMKEETKRAGELADAKVRLRNIDRDIEKATAKQRLEIKKLQLVADDVTKSYDERIEAAKRAGQIELRLIEAQKAAQNERIAIIQGEIKQGNVLAEQKDQLAEAQTKLYELEQQSLEQQTTLNNKVNALVNERLRLQLELQNAFEEGVKNMLDALTDAEIEFADGTDKFLLQREKIVAAIEAEKQSLIKIAQELGKPTEDIENAYDRIIEAATKDVDQNLLFQGLIDDGIQLDIPVREIKFDLQPTATDKAALDLKEKFAIIKDVILTSLGIDDKDVELILSNLESAFGNIVDVYSSSIDQRIKDNERFITQLQKEQKELESQLERQQELREEGEANNYDLIKSSLDRKEQLEQEAAAKSERLKRQQAKVQLAIDAAQATQSLLTSAANVMQSTSSIPFAGVAIGIAYVAAMFAAFAKFRSQSRSLTRLSGGASNVGDYLGFVDKGGQDDTYGRGKGYSIHDPNGNDTGVRMGGNEMLFPQRAALMHQNELMALAQNPEDYEIIKKYNSASSGLSRFSDFTFARKASDKMDKRFDKLSRDIVNAINKKPVAYVVNEDTKKIVVLKGNEKEVVVLKN